MASEKVPELTNGEFEDFTKSGIVLIDFFADWCMPCIMMSPVIEELSDKFKGKIKFGKVNVDDNTKLAQKFEVNSIPNFVLIKDGKKVGQFVGAMPHEDFSEKLAQYV